MQTIRLFCDIARYRSFSQAAAEHGITQSAASQRIGSLEKRLGVELLDRSVRPLALTAAGELYLRGCRQIVQRYDELEDQVAGLHPNGQQSQIIVDAIYSAGIDLLNHLKEAYEEQHPHVTVVLDYKRPDEVYDAVRQHRCDLGIVSYPQRWREVAVIPLRNETMAVVCAPGHPLAGRDQVEAAELSGWSMVSFEQSLPVARAIRRYLREQGATPQITNVFDNIDTIKHALTVTEQVAILPRRTVLREVESGTLAVVALAPELSRPIGVIHARLGQNRPMRADVRAFVDFLLEHAGPDSDWYAQTQARLRQTVGAGK